MKRQINQIAKLGFMSIIFAFASIGCNDTDKEIFENVAPKDEKATEEHTEKKKSPKVKSLNPS